MDQGRTRAQCPLGPSRAHGPGPGPMGQGPWARAHGHGHGNGDESGRLPPLCGETLTKKRPHFLVSLKDAQRPYDQNGCSIAPRSLIFDPIAKETVYTKTHILKGSAAMTKAEEFPVPARPHPITQGYHIPFGSLPLLRYDT